MQCPRCGFENLPGLTTCMRCQSAMKATAKIDVNPPRAGWKRLYRPLVYRYNKLGVRMPNIGIELGTLSQTVEILGGFLWGALSIVPGLGHIVTRRFRQARWLLLFWAVSFFSGLFLFGTQVGFLLLGLAIATHVWIILDAIKIPELFPKMRDRMILIFAIYFVLGFFAYPNIRTWVVVHWFSGVTVSMDIVTDGIQNGDYLVFQSRAYDHEQPKRGDVVIYRMDTGGFVNRGMYVQQEQSVGKILGMPGEHLISEKGLLTIISPNGAKSSVQVEPPLGWEGQIDVPSNGYFCRTTVIVQYVGHGGPNVNARELEKDFGKVAPNGIVGRGWYLYQPFWRRARIPHASWLPAPTPPQTAGKA